MAKEKLLKVGMKVAFNTLKDPYWFEILQINGFNLIIREENKPDHAEQIMDKCYVKQVRA